MGLAKGVYVVGEEGVGKSSLLNNLFSLKQQTEEKSLLVVNINDISILAYETAEFHESKLINLLQTTEFLCLIIVYDISNRESFYAAITKWFCVAEDFFPNAITFLVGCKTDLELNRQVLTQEGSDFINGFEKEKLFFEVSTKAKVDDLAGLRSSICSCFSRKTDEFNYKPDGHQHSFEKIDKGFLCSEIFLYDKSTIKPYRKQKYSGFNFAKSSSDIYYSGLHKFDKSQQNLNHSFIKPRFMQPTKSSEHMVWSSVPKSNVELEGNSEREENRVQRKVINISGNPSYLKSTESSKSQRYKNINKNNVKFKQKREFSCGSYHNICSTSNKFVAIERRKGKVTKGKKLAKKSNQGQKSGHFNNLLDHKIITEDQVIETIQTEDLPGMISERLALQGDSHYVLKDKVGSLSSDDDQVSRDNNCEDASSTHDDLTTELQENETKLLNTSKDEKKFAPNMNEYKHKVDTDDNDLLSLLDDFTLSFDDSDNSNESDY